MAGDNTDYYPNPAEGADTSTATAETEQANNEKPESGKDAGESALVAKSVLGKEVEPGDTITFKVKHVYGDEVALVPVNETESETEMSPDEEIDMMDRMGKKGMM